MTNLELLLKNRELPLIMGIVNATYDSFSNGGAFGTVDQALQMLDEGADIIDIGGESTRPGAAEVAWQDEIDRVLPLIKGIKKCRPDAVLSVDTRKAEVAKAVLDEGVEIINDVSNLEFSDKMAETVAAYGATLVLMHSRGNPQTMNDLCGYDDLVAEVKNSLLASMKKALTAGVKKEHIWIDPGLGFAKTDEQNFELLREIKQLKEIAPVLIGHSRKRFIRNFLNIETSEADFGTAAVSIYAMMQGADILRVHNVKNTYEVLKIFRKCNSYE